jgi:hypothetical protein
MINQAYGQLKGKEGAALIEGIRKQQLAVAEEVAGGKIFYQIGEAGEKVRIPLRYEVAETVLKKGDLGPKETKFIDGIFKAYRAQGIGKGCPIKRAEGGRIGFNEAGLVDDDCMRNAIQEHNKKLQKGDSVSRAKQFRINKTKSMKNLLGLGMKGVRGLAGVVGGWGGVAIEAAIEGAFYEHAKRQGQTDEQARENLFFPKIAEKLVPDIVKDTELWKKYGIKPFKTGIIEGPEKLIEEELLAGNESAQEYAQGMKALEDEYDTASKIEFELRILKNQWRPGSEEQIEAKEQELKNSYDRMEKLEINIKPGTPKYEAYVAAQEKQKAAQDARAQEHWGDTPGYRGSKQRQWQDEFLDYRGAKRKYRKDQPFAFKGGLEGSITGPNQFIDWDAYSEYGLDDPKKRWKTIYDVGGFDLMDRIGIAGGVSKLANGGIASLTTTVAPTRGPVSQGEGLDYLRKHGRGY